MPPLLPRPGKAKRILTPAAFNQRARAWVFRHVSLQLRVIVIRKTLDDAL
jgi:hypothetical protein